MEKRLAARECQNDGASISDSIDAVDQFLSVDWRRNVIKLVTVPTGQVAPTGDN